MPSQRLSPCEDHGFSLVELMVVVLIMGILMAIAVPTLLSTRTSANDAAAKTNASNAFTNEKAYYVNNSQEFFPVTTTAEGDSLDDTVPWGDVTNANANDVVAAYVANGTGSYTGTDNVLVVEASSASGNCFYIEDSENSQTAQIGYASTSSACLGSSATSDTGPPQSGAAGVETASLSSTSWFQAW